jgi:hypothetical protein
MGVFCSASWNTFAIVVVFEASIEWLTVVGQKVTVDRDGVIWRASQAGKADVA